jgi:lipopolysaccharide transport system permease protein
MDDHRAKVPVSGRVLSGRRRAHDAARRPIRIVAQRRTWTPDLAELWDSRELLYFLVWRDLKVRYKQTALGAAWAIIQPLVTMVVLSVVFGGLAGVPSDGVPYPVFALSALVPWTFFAQGISGATNSLVGSQNVLKKVYFPRILIPVAVVLSGLADFALAFLVLLGMMPFFGIVPTVSVLWAIPALLLALATCIGVGVGLAALNVRYRDIGYMVPFLLQVWLFATPVAYPSSLFPEPWRTLYSLNPMVGVVEGFRWALLGVDNGAPRALLIGAVVSLAVLVTGAYYFGRNEGTFADVA